MNKTAIKNFAIWARRKLISDITFRAGMLGISENGIAQPMKQSTKDVQFFDIGTKDYVEISGAEIQQRNALLAAIRNKERTSDYKTAFRSVVEEVAYTWFNRLIAVRFMEVNDYLPSHVRVLSSSNPNKLEPDFVTTPFETDLEFSPYETDIVLQLKDQNKLDELFRFLFIKQCNKLGEILPELFEKISDYTELLLTISFTDKDGVIYHLTHDISEDDFNVEKEGQAEIIGWLYQYYISEKHEEVIDPLHGKVVKKEDIPAATQLFTTDWVVRYILDNSLGRYWIERNPESKLAEKLQFFVTPKDGNIPRIDDRIRPEELRVLDPCVGSGHFLSYAYDILIEIYRENGWSDRDAAVSILKNNLYGLDIDDRAAQLAYFAVMMKARKHNRRVLTLGLAPNVCSLQETSLLSEGLIQYIAAGNQAIKGTFEEIKAQFCHAKELGSIILLPQMNLKSVQDRTNEILSKPADNLIDMQYHDAVREIVLPLVQQAVILSERFHVVATNPPYLNKYSPILKSYILEHFANYKGDLFSVFMFRNFGLCKPNGYTGFMTPMVWMFIKTYEELRKYIIVQKSITSLIQFEYSAFEEATVPICSFILKNGQETSKGLYFRLSDFRGGMDVQRQKVLEALSDRDCGYYYEAVESNFSKIPGSPVAYWVGEVFLNTFGTNMSIESSSVCETKLGMSTNDNNRFLRLWYEVGFQRICTHRSNSQKDDQFAEKWFPYNKGGEYRKWFGNILYVINWENNGFEVKQLASDLYGSYSRTCKNTQHFFREAITWSLITSGNSSFRYLPQGCVLGDAGPVCFVDKKYMLYVLGILNSAYTTTLLPIINPTINCSTGVINQVPICIDEEKIGLVSITVKESIIISKTDWDSFETSWDFRKHPLVPLAYEKKEQENSQWGKHRMELFGKIESHYRDWEYEAENRFNQLKANEEELNRIFIDIYGLQDELTPEVEDKDVTVRKADLQREIRSLISYAVGCMFGRYSLDVPGLAYAGGAWDDSKYSSFIPDPDNCIPITDTEYFRDDIVGRFVEFIRTAYGEESLEENLEFIANALGNKGKTTRETLRLYFLNDFYSDHLKIYQKRPIYWLFDSGKQNGFKALAYMHRWNADTVGNLRVEYLHKMQTVYEKEIENCQDAIDNSLNNREIATATKRKEKLIKQLKECKDYDAKVAHIALSRIVIDLDDGVKVNYRKVQTGADGRFCEILADSKDIMVKEK